MSNELAQYYNYRENRRMLYGEMFTKATEIVPIKEDVEVEKKETKKGVKK